MKKTIITFIFILLGVYGILSFLDRNGEYVAEEMIWKANKKFFELTKDPTSVPDKNFIALNDQYQKVIDRFPKSPLAKKAYLTIGRLYLVKKDYATARTKTKIVLKQYPQDSETLAEAMSIIGKSYELQNNWSEALKIYDEIVLKYPLTEIGMSIPLYIALYYQAANATSNAQVAFQKAIEHYRNLAQKYSKSQNEFKSLRLLANCYFEQKMWFEGVNTLGETLTKYATRDYIPPQRADLLIKTINTVSIVQLKSYDIPIKIYENFISKHPKHGLNKVLKEMIRNLNTLKNKNVEIKTKKE